MGKLTRHVLCFALLLFAFVTPVSAEDTAGPVSIDLPVSILPAEGEQNGFAYSYDVSVQALDSAPAPDRSVVNLSTSAPSDTFTVVLPVAGIYEYKATPAHRSGSAELTDSTARILRIWRYRDGTYGIKAYVEGDPSEGVDTVWYVRDTTPVVPMGGIGGIGGNGSNVSYSPATNTTLWTRGFTRSAGRNLTILNTSRGGDVEEDEEPSSIKRVNTAADLHSSAWMTALCTSGLLVWWLAGAGKRRKQEER